MNPFTHKVMAIEDNIDCCQVLANTSPLTPIGIDWESLLAMQSLLDSRHIWVHWIHFSHQVFLNSSEDFFPFIISETLLMTLFRQNWCHEESAQTIGCISGGKDYTGESDSLIAHITHHTHTTRNTHQSRPALDIYQALGFGSDAFQWHFKA